MITVITKKAIFSLTMLFVLAAPLSGCGKTQEDYKKAIKLKGITYSIGNFIKQINKGNKEIVELFVKAGIDVNAKDENGDTALHRASFFGDTEIVKLLIDKGADVNAKSRQDITALIEASYMGHTEVVKFLINKGADVNAKNEHGDTALTVASRQKHTEIVKLLIDKGADTSKKINQ